MLKISKDSSKPIYIQIYEFYKEIILSKEVPGSYRLPNSRHLASLHKISRNSVLAAYELLKSEDLVTSKQGSGYYVTRVTKIKKYEETKETKEDRIYLNFSDYPNVISKIAIDKWLKFIRKEINNISPLDMTVKESFHGHPELIKQIQMIYFKYFELSIPTQDIVIGNNTEYLFEIILNITDGRIKTMALGNKNNIRLINYLNENDVKVLFYENINKETLEYLKKEECDAIFVNPNLYHDYGTLLSLPKRKLLVNFAIENDIYIIEGNSPSEYIYTTPLPTLMKLSNYKNVFFIDSLSKTLGSNMHSHFIAIPHSLSNSLSEKYWFKSPSLSFVNEYLIYRFLEEQFDSLIRQTKKSFFHMQKLLIKQLEEQFGNKAETHGKESGTSIVVCFDYNVDNKTILKAFRKKGINVGYMDEAFLKSHKRKNAIVLNFSYQSESSIKRGVSIMKTVLEGF